MPMILLVPDLRLALGGVTLGSSLGHLELEPWLAHNHVIHCCRYPPSCHKSITNKGWRHDRDLSLGFLHIAFLQAQEQG